MKFSRFNKVVTNFVPRVRSLSRPWRESETNTSRKETWEQRLSGYSLRLRGNLRFRTVNDEQQIFDLRIIYTNCDSTINLTIKIRLLDSLHKLIYAIKEMNLTNDKLCKCNIC